MQPEEGAREHWSHRQQYLLLCGHTLDEAEESSIANGHFVAGNEL